AWQKQGLWVNDDLHWTAFALLVCAIALGAVAFANRREQLAPQVSKFAGLLAALILVTSGAVAIISGDFLDLHHAARTWSWESVLVLAHAGAMALERRRWLREASVALGVAGLVFIYLGSMSFLERFVKDPFVARAPGIVVKTVSPPSLAEASVPFEVST